MRLTLSINSLSALINDLRRRGASYCRRASRAFYAQPDWRLIVRIADITTVAVVPLMRIG